MSQPPTDPPSEPSVTDLASTHNDRADGVVSIRASGRMPVALGVAIAAFFVLAIAKPWSDIASPDVAIPTTTAVPTPVAPAAKRSAEPAILLDLREHCQEPLGWRVYSQEARNDRSLRAWYSVEPIARANGPLDPAIPSVRLGPGIIALGYCSPWTGAERPPDPATVDAWRVGPNAAGTAARLSLEPVAPVQRTSLGALYRTIGDVAAAATAGSSRGPATGGPSREPASQPGWPAGRYVFAIRGSGWDRWWAVDIAESDAAGPTATDRAGASAAP